MLRRFTDRDRRPGRSRSNRPRVEALDTRLLLASASAEAVQVRLVGDVLEIQGTRRADGLSVLPTTRAGVLRVAGNGRELGSFGPVSRIDIVAGGGNDVVRIDPRVTTPARIDSGPGDDVLRGGSGPNAFYAGPGDDTVVFSPGRDTFDGGGGRTRLVRVEGLGVVQVSASASGSGLKRLAGPYQLTGLRVVGPSVVAPSDLGNSRIVQLLKESYAGGNTVALARPTEAGANALARLLGDPRPVDLPDGVGRADLVAFRKTAVGGQPTFEVSTLLPSLRRDHSRAAVLGSRAADASFLGRVFSAVPQVTGRSAFGDPSDDLTNLASAYVSRLSYEGNTATSQLFTTVYSARSFTQQADYYYVSQEVQTVGWGGDLGQVGTGGHIRATGTPPQYGLKGYPVAIQPSPAENPQTTSYTTSVSENFGATVGWNEDSGFNATIGGGVSLEQSATYTVPPLQILYYPNLTAGTTNWIFVSNNGVLDQLTVNNSWIWIVDFDLYHTGQTTLPFQAYAVVGAANAPMDYQALDNASAPIPFGDVFQLQTPVVSSVSTPTVSPGAKFTVTGSAFYPSLVESIVLNGQVLDPSSYTVVSDTQIEVVAPNAPGTNLPIVVKTTQGLSNASVTISIAGTTGAITVQSLAVSAVAGQAFSNVTVANVTDPNTSVPASDLSATVNWGDGTASPGTLTATGPGTFAVAGSHNYATAGTYTFNVQVSDTGGSKGSASGTATVAPPGTGGGVQNLDSRPILGVANQAFTNAVAATFSDSDFGAAPTDFTAAISWGDGTLTPVTTVVAASSGFEVLGSHLYTTAGQYTFQVQVTDKQGRKTLTSGVASVSS